MTKPNAVLVVDMILGCLNEKWRVRDGAELETQITAISKLLVWAGSETPVFFAEYPPYGSTIPEVAGSANRPTIVNKRDESAFYGTDLYEQLTKLGTRTLAIAGINMSACVQSTAMHALQIGLNVTTSLDLITDFEWEDCVIPEIGRKMPPFKNRALPWFKEYTHCMETYESVIAFLEQNCRRR